MPSRPSESASERAPAGHFPRPLRWAALLWLITWVPIYWKYWGGVNFLHFSDLALVFSCVGFCFDSALLISSQVVAALGVYAAWTLDLLWTLVFRHHLLGGTEYMFDPHYPLWVRLLSLFHIWMPALLLWAIRRAGYDHRGWILQSAIALPGFIASRFTDPALNMNYAFSDPFFHRQWGPTGVHILVAYTFMLVVVYLPTHLILSRIFPAPSTARATL